MAASTGNNGGTRVLGLLGVIFVTLKLCGVVDWSWWLVTVPFWGIIAADVALTLSANVIGIPILLGIVFIVLKLSALLAWPWLWVTAPLWGLAALILSIVLAWFAFGRPLPCTGRKS